MSWYWLEQGLATRYSFQWIPEVGGQLFICGGFAVLIVVALVLANLAEKKKIEAFQRFALAHDFDFFASAAHAGFSLAEYEGFQPITHMGGQTKYVFQAEYNYVLKFRAFHYQYTTSTGKSSTTHYYSVASLDMPCWLQDFSISEEGMLDAIGKFFGGQDIQLESDDFNRRFRVKGMDEQIVHQLLHPQAMEWFMSKEPLGFQIIGNRMVVYKYGQLNEMFVATSRNTLLEFWDLIPSFVKEDRGA